MTGGTYTAGAFTGGAGGRSAAKAAPLNPIAAQRSVMNLVIPQGPPKNAESARSRAKDTMGMPINGCKKRARLADQGSDAP